MTTDLDRAVRASLGDIIATAPEPVDQPMQLVRVGDATPPRRPYLAIAASVVVVLAGVAGLIAVRADDRTPAGSPSNPDSQAASPAVIEVPSVENETSKVPWDQIAIAPGTVGWFEFGDLPADLAARVGKITSYSNDYSSVFFHCVTWTENDGTITCTKLAGGNYVQLSYFGPAPATGASNGLGTQLGDGLDAAQVLWAVAQGSLWGYDTVTAPPKPTPVAIGSITGLSYRSGDSAYLAWERAPGVILWLAATGYTDQDMAQLAASVRPVTVTSLPLLIDVGSTATDSYGLPRSLKVASVDGIRCASITLYTECTRIDQGPALVRTLDGSGPAVAAIVPSGTTASLVVALADGQVRTVPLTATGLNINTAIYAAVAGETMSSAQIVNANGEVMQRITLAGDAGTPTPTTAASASSGPAARSETTAPTSG